MEQLRLSSHADVRLQQRGFRPRDVTLVTRYGTRVQDGFVLLAGDVAQVEAELKHLLVGLHRLSGTFVAVEENVVLSVYRPDRVRRRRLLARAVSRHPKRAPRFEPSDERASQLTGVGRNRRAEEDA